MSWSMSMQRISALRRRRRSHLATVKAKLEGLLCHNFNCGNSIFQFQWMHNKLAFIVYRVVCLIITENVCPMMWVTELNLNSHWFYFGIWNILIRISKSLSNKYNSILLLCICVFELVRYHCDFFKLICMMLNARSSRHQH